MPHHQCSNREALFLHWFVEGSKFSESNLHEFILHECFTCMEAEDYGLVVMILYILKENLIIFCGKM
jgi:hypothetical protein